MRELGNLWCGIYGLWKFSGRRGGGRGVREGVRYRY